MIAREAWRTFLTASCTLLPLSGVGGCKPKVAVPPPAAAVAPAKPAPPPAVAHLLGKPVLAEDCLSENLGIEDRDRGFAELASLAVQEDYCREHKLIASKDDVQAGLAKLNQGLKNKLGGADVEQLLEGLSPEEKEALKGLKDLAKLPSPESLVPYDPGKASDELEMVKMRLERPKVSWLDRLALEERQRAAKAVKENKAMQAGEVLRAVQAEKFHRAAYEQYKGKVVAASPSGVLPAEALLKLLRDYEGQGKLKIEDERLRVAFWTWAEERLQGEEIPPEQIDFTPPLFQGGSGLPANAGDLLKGL